MSFNRQTFFAYVRRAPFGGRLVQAQIDGMNRILDYWGKSSLTDVRWLAYMLATTFHETAATMQPIREMGGEAYLRSKRYYPWVGEGLVQVTWEANHKKFGATAPGQLLTWEKALPTLFKGCTNGMFTGKRLSDYFNGLKEEPVGARRIINGTDKASLIAGYYKNFLDALNAADVATPQPTDATAEAAKPDDVAPSQSPAAVTAGGLAAVGGVVTATAPLITGIANPWQFAGLALFVVAAGIAAWLVLSGRITINRRA